MSLFFLTGLPRNRTSWLANLLSHGSDSFCHHDGLKAHTPKSLVHSMRESNFLYSGDSDSALLIHIEEIIQLVPDARWVLLKRSPFDAYHSFHTYFAGRYPGTPKDPDQLWQVFQHAQAYFRRAEQILPHALKVDFEDLYIQEKVESIWKHCLPSIEFPLERWKMLDTFRVNVIPEKITLKQYVGGAK